MTRRPRTPGSGVPWPRTASVAPAQVKRGLRQQELMVDIPTGVRPFWDKFQTALSHDASSLFYEAFHFDDNERTANVLCALVLSGHKRATAGLLWTNEVTNKPLPTLGALSVVTDWHGTPVCVIQSTHVEIVSFERVSDSFATAEGEGDGSLRHWRAGVDRLRRPLSRALGARHN